MKGKIDANLAKIPSQKSITFLDKITKESEAQGMAGMVWYGMVW